MESHFESSFHSSSFSIIFTAISFLLDNIPYVYSSLLILHLGTQVLIHNLNIIKWSKDEILYTVSCISSRQDSSSHTQTYRKYTPELLELLHYDKMALYG